MSKGFRIEWRKGDTVTTLLCTVDTQATATALADKLLHDSPRLKGYKVSEVAVIPRHIVIAAEAEGKWQTFDDPVEPKRRKKANDDTGG